MTFQSGLIMARNDQNHLYLMTYYQRDIPLKLDKIIYIYIRMRVNFAVTLNTNVLQSSKKV